MERINGYRVFPSRQDVLEALESLPSPGAKDEGIVMLVAQAYAEGSLHGDFEELGLR